jgi:hypothetical protein
LQIQDSGSSRYIPLLPSILNPVTARPWANRSWNSAFNPATRHKERIFYGLTVASVIVLRIRRPNLERSFRVPAYPWVPIFFAAAAIGVSASTILSDPIHAMR